MEWINRGVLVIVGLVLGSLVTHYAEEPLPTSITIFNKLPLAITIKLSTPDGEAGEIATYPSMPKNTRLDFDLLPKPPLHRATITFMEMTP